ncbi:MAG: thymidine phosphorylase [Bacilli bacterium]|nr:thymidine phosphorylase [Bacilli bacterium]
MNIVDIINKKEEGNELSYEEIKYAVDGYLADEVKDYQMSSLLMAIEIKGMNIEEIYNLTKVMIDSGDIIDLSSINGIKVDKHSTGGVGDKTTLVVGPLAAVCGIKIAKMSGRALGFTGGTIDKLESIKGFNTNLSKEEFINQVNDIGLSITTTAGNLVPADKKIYALRDVSGTTEAIPLIASSIMSKKIASGSDKIIIDVKVGKGAFMKTLDDARLLSKTMIEIGKRFNKEVIAIITNMDYPLGNTIGNSLEVQEAIDTLNGNGDERFTKLCLILSSYMVSVGKNISIEDAFDEVVEKLNNKEGLNKFYEFIKYQGGDINSLEFGKNKIEIKSDKEGYLTDIDTLNLAGFINSLGAGRKDKNDKINPKVGFILTKKINDKIEKNDTLGYVISDSDIDINNLNNYFIIDSKNIDEINIVLDIIK